MATVALGLYTFIFSIFIIGHAVYVVILDFGWVKQLLIIGNTRNFSF